ncbi:hypothetical protein [Stakelama tenebrarum]|uniref:Lipoprotein n=1 Tax=Stakelama tenebrarum TaxID=2711215 RepID=A0A6G6Y458_9SPHN|nr:hypothetical protein [Sphingosinithalassobacter tenebrarum]QIG79631.1 hypothetical protein G5C33_07395 [Sphingosinithalassobacter tenebrarum]
MKRSYLTIAALSGLAACSSAASEEHSAFVRYCIQSGAYKEVCSCYADNMQQDVSAQGRAAFLKLLEEGADITERRVVEPEVSPADYEAIRHAGVPCAQAAQTQQ